MLAGFHRSKLQFFGNIIKGSRISLSQCITLMLDTSHFYHQLEIAGATPNYDHHTHRPGHVWIHRTATPSLR
jgi:hypothetical protein